MKIPSSYLRKKIGSLLDGSVTYDDGEGFNDLVPVVASEGVESKYQIFIGDYSDADRSNAHVFGANATQVIEIVETDAPVRRFSNVDAIGELVTALLMPSPQGAVMNGTDFHIVVNRPSVNHISEPSGTGKIINRLLLRYSLLIHHN